MAMMFIVTCVSC